MTRGGSFHRDLQPWARWLPRRPIGPRLLRPTRSAIKASGRWLADPDVDVEWAGEIALRVHRPRSRRPGVPGLLWIHGGGFVIGSAVQDDKFCRRLADGLGIMVAAVEYRLAPEHPFPVPLEDCYRGLEWLAASGEIDPDRVAVGGASAGGGLAAALAIAAHQRGEIGIAFQSLVYPMLDDHTAARREMDGLEVRLWDNRSNRFGWSSYTAETPGAPGISSLAAPARHDDLAGLPPAWIGVGTCDLFHEEDVAYAQRLREAGVACALEVVEGAYHGFDSVQPKAGVSRDFRASQTRALADALITDEREG